MPAAMDDGDSYENVMRRVQVIDPLRGVDLCNNVAVHQGALVFQELRVTTPPPVFINIIGAVSAGVMDALPKDIRYKQADIIRALVAEYFCNIVPEQQVEILERCATTYWQTIRTQLLLLKVQENLR